MVKIAVNATDDVKKVLVWMKLMYSNGKWNLTVDVSQLVEFAMIILIGLSVTRRMTHGIGKEKITKDGISKV